LDHLQIVLYTRQGCHLCEEAWRHLEKERDRWQFTLEKIDIGESKSLTAQFGDQIPVVTVNREVRIWGKVNPVLLIRLLRGELKKREVG